MQYLLTNIRMDILLRLKNRRMYRYTKQKSTWRGIFVILISTLSVSNLFRKDQLNKPPAWLESQTRFLAETSSRVFSTFASKAQHPILATCYLTNTLDLTTRVTWSVNRFRTISYFRHVGLTRVHHHHILSLYKIKAYPLLLLPRCCCFTHRRFSNSVSFSSTFNRRR